MLILNQELTAAALPHTFSGARAPPRFSAIPRVCNGM